MKKTFFRCFLYSRKETCREEKEKQVTKRADYLFIYFTVTKRWIRGKTMRGGRIDVRILEKKEAPSLDCKECMFVCEHEKMSLRSRITASYLS